LYHEVSCLERRQVENQMVLCLKLVLKLDILASETFKLRTLLRAE